MQVSSRVLFLLFFSCTIFLYILVSIFIKKVELNQLQEKYIQLKKENHNMLQDKRWLNWGMPKNYLEYCILWLFEQNPTSKITFKAESEIDYNIKSCFFEIETTSELKLPEAPFGQINVIEPKNQVSNKVGTDIKAGGKEKFLVEWQMSTELEGSPHLRNITKEIDIKLNYIILQKNGDWCVKINEYILKKGEKLFWQNVEIVEIGENWVILKAFTPKGTLKQKLFCGESWHIDYV